MDAPQPYKTAGICMTISAAFSTMALVMWALALLGSCYFACFVPIPLLLILVTAWEAYVGLQMAQGRKVDNPSINVIIGLVMAMGHMMLCMGIVPLALEIVALLQLGQPEAKAYLAEPEL